MATLYSTNKEKSISLYLYKDIENNEWLKYQIIVDYQKCNQMSKRIIFSEETAENVLFLECYLEPEIPELIKGFKDVFEDNVDMFEFEPIDEKDFYLSVVAGESRFCINLVLRFACKTEEIVFYTNKEHIRVFLLSLNEEYTNIINNKYGIISL